MASVYQDPKTKMYIVQVHRRGKVRVGKNKAIASNTFAKLEALEYAKNSGLPPDPQTSGWVAALPVEAYLYKRLVKIELIQPRATARTMQELLDEFTNRCPKNTNSRELYKQVTDPLARFLGADKHVRDVTEQDAFAFKEWLLDQGRLVEHPEHGFKLAEATVARRIKGARQVFKLAIKLGWAPIREGDGFRYPYNPFADIKAGRQFNPDRLHFVHMDVANKIIANLPTDEFKLAFALARFAGMRSPSELVSLKPSNINLRAAKMTFDAPKTAGYIGKEIRECPIFKEDKTGINLAKYFTPTLMQNDYLLPTFRCWNNPGISFTKVFDQMIAKLDMYRFPKPFVNCRGSRATEVARLYGPKNEADWIGHSEQVSMRHYQMQMPDDWQNATGYNTSV